MITEGDTSNIVYGLCKVLGLPVYQNSRHSDSPRVVIHAHKQERDKQYMKNFVDVNVVVADEDNEAKTALLKEYERTLQDMFYIDIVGEKDGHAYVVALMSLGIEEDSTLKSHFVNCKLLFSVLR